MTTSGPLAAGLFADVSTRCAAFVVRGRAAQNGQQGIGVVLPSRPRTSHLKVAPAARDLTHVLVYWRPRQAGFEVDQSNCLPVVGVEQ